jgi:hypothetical protein
MAAIGFAAQDRRKQLHHRRAVDPAAFMIPAAVGADFHRAVARARRMPAFDRRQFARREQFGGLGRRKLREGFGKRGRGADHQTDIGRWVGK